MKYLILLSDMGSDFLRPTYQLTDDPYAVLGWRVADGIMSAKQARATEIFSIEALPIDQVMLNQAIADEQLIARARKGDTAYVIGLYDKKKISLVEIEQLRVVLNARDLTGTRWDAPWPWKKAIPDQDE